MKKEQNEKYTPISLKGLKLLGKKVKAHVFHFIRFNLHEQKYSGFIHGIGINKQSREESKVETLVNIFTLLSSFAKGHYRQYLPLFSGSRIHQSLKK